VTAKLGTELREYAIVEVVHHFSPSTNIVAGVARVVKFEYDEALGHAQCMCRWTGMSGGGKRSSMHLVVA
jgi:hypothetical protein